MNQNLIGKIRLLVYKALQCIPDIRCLIYVMQQMLTIMLEFLYSVSDTRSCIPSSISIFPFCSIMFPFLPISMTILLRNYLQSLLFYMIANKL